MGRLDGTKLYATCFVGVAVYVAIATVTAISLANYHILNRSGALLAALGAVAVIWQVLVEERFELGNEMDNQAVSPSELSPANLATAHRIVGARTNARRRHRVRIVTCIAFVVMVGEVMHGWGDFIGESLGPELHAAQAADSPGRMESEAHPENSH